MAHTWELQKGEAALWYKRFVELYLAGGEERTLEGAYRVHRTRRAKGALSARVLGRIEARNRRATGARFWKNRGAGPGVKPANSGLGKPRARIGQAEGRRRARNQQETSTRFQPIAAFRRVDQAVHEMAAFIAWASIRPRRGRRGALRSHRTSRP
jgi:hypothetical protein